MADDHRPARDDPSSPENNPLGLGARDPKGPDTGSIADTQYDAEGSDPYTTGEPVKDLRASGDKAAPEAPPPEADEVR